MPKQPKLNKDIRRRRSSSSRSFSSKPNSVKDLLAKAGITSNAIAQHSVNEEFWHNFLRRSLSDELAEEVRGTSLARGTLTVLASTAGWALRLRYALEEQLAAIQQQDARVQKVVVKVTVGR
jgi:hypothetical protein